MGSVHGTLDSGFGDGGDSAGAPGAQVVPYLGAAGRATTHLLQLGLLAVVLVALPFKPFELDRYFVPKELALHVIALGAAVLLLARTRTNRVDAVDALLAFFVAWSTISALFAANHWVAQRALGVSVSSAVVFWAARRLGAAGSYRPILVAAGLATVLGALACLAQAYGLDTEYFSLNRAPGGTFGNRNSVAHFAAIGLPALVYSAVTARRPIGALFGTIGVGAVAASLVLSRSRAAWLAIMACLVILMLPFLVSRRYWRGRGIGRRALRLAATAIATGGVAIVLPNRLNWRSDSPYLDSARALVEYGSGSGRGRVAQYQNSLRMAVANPILGVGPGNWPVRYVRFAPAGDRSIADDGMTANAWPSSDWVAYFSERGIVAALALLGVFASLFIGACLRWRALGDAEAVLAKLVLLATITATFVVSAFDAVLLLPAPAFLAWAVMGAASGVGRGGREKTLARTPWIVVAGVVLTIVVASAVRSAFQTAAIATVGTGATRVGWVRAAGYDPGSYRINLRVAEQYAASGRCASARPYARRALGLFPYAPAPRRVLRSCG